MAKNMLDVVIVKVALEALLKRVQGAAEKSGTMDILRCVLLIIDGIQLQATATDLEIGITSRVDLESVETRGRITVPLSMLLNIVQRMPGPEIHLKETSGRQLIVTAGDAEITINCEDSDDYPVWADPAGECALAIDADVYQQLIKSCKHAICTDYTKYSLTGINFQLIGQRLTACATDGHRLSLAGKDIEVGSLLSVNDFNHLISKKAITEIEKLSPGPVQIYIYDNQVAFVQARTTLAIRLLDGEFPNYRQIIPNDHPGYVGLVAIDFLKSIDRVRQVVNIKSKGIQVEASGNQITLTAKSETGHARDITSAEIDGAGFQGAVSASYLSDAVAGLGDEVIIKYNTGIEPIVLLPQDYGSLDERLEIIMPMRN